MTLSWSREGCKGPGPCFEFLPNDDFLSLKEILHLCSTIMIMRIRAIRVPLTHKLRED